MIYFDELSVAQNMESATTQVDEYKKSDVLLYAKYLRYKKIIDAGKSYDDVTLDDMIALDNQIEKELIAFCNKYYTDYNYIVRFQDIDTAVDRSRYYKLKLPLPTPITQSEWDAICQIDNDNYRRMLFVMLVDAKYNRLHSTAVENTFEVNEDTLFYCRMCKSDIYKAGKCKFENAEEKLFSLGCFYEHGLFDITNNKYRSWFLKFVDISSNNIIEYITDYDHINLHYDKISGVKIGTCKMCGKLFKQNKNGTGVYCYKHRGYNKLEKRKIRIDYCVDCGEQFSVPATDTNKCRCNKCQRIKHLKDMKQWRLSKKSV